MRKKLDFIQGAIMMWFMFTFAITGGITFLLHLLKAIAWDTIEPRFWGIFTIAGFISIIILTMGELEVKRTDDEIE
jgi:hypothetical protein